jgi:hypothetical protein
MWCWNYRKRGTVLWFVHPRKKTAASLLPAFVGFLLDPDFHPEDGADMFSKTSGSF